MSELRDMFSNTIEPGTIIAYPGRSGSSLWMNAAIVERVEMVAH